MNLTTQRPPARASPGSAWDGGLISVTQKGRGGEGNSSESLAEGKSCSRAWIQNAGSTFFPKEKIEHCEC